MEDEDADDELKASENEDGSLSPSSSPSPPTLCGCGLGELAQVANALVACGLAFLPLLTRGKGGQASWVEANPPVELRAPVARFFNDCRATLGGRIVLENLFVLFAGASASAMLETHRAAAVRASRGAGAATRALVLAGAAFPILAQFLGVSIVYPLLVAWFWRARRTSSSSSSSSTSASSYSSAILDPVVVVASCATALLVLAVVEWGAFDVRREHRDGEEGGNDDFPALLAFLGVPLLPSIGLLAYHLLWEPTAPNTSPPPSRRTRLLCGVLSMATYLLVGACGFAAHTEGFTQLEAGISASAQASEGVGKSAVNRIMKDILTNPPSKFIFVDYVHLCLGMALFCAGDMKGSGGAALVFFVASVVGPAGAFGLLAAHHEFRLMKAGGVLA